MPTSPPNILLDAPSWFCRPNSTDWQMKLSFVREMPEFQASIVDSWLFNLVYSAQYVSIHFLSGRAYEWFTHLCARIRAWILERKGAQIVISQGIEPPLPKGAKVIWETYFLDSTPRSCNRGALAPESVDTEFRRGGSNMWIRAMERFGGKVAVIGVRGTASVTLLKTMYPEYAAKVHDLNFVYPEYVLMSEADIRRKQEGTGPIRILFIGRAARRKGLVPLLEALTRLRAEGVDGFTFTIVSDFVDGTIELPGRGRPGYVGGASRPAGMPCPGYVGGASRPAPDWVDHKVSVSHDEAMELMRQAQVFVMPSFFESYGLVYLEALASGCVTFVPDQDPQREFVDSGRAGQVIDPRDVPDMVEKLRAVITKPDLRMSLALAGRRHYESTLSQSFVRAKWREAIECLRLEV